MSIKYKILAMPLISTFLIGVVAFGSLAIIENHARKVLVQDKKKLEAALEMEINVNEAAGIVFDIIYDDVNSSTKRLRYHQAVRDFGRYREHYFRDADTVDTQKIDTDFAAFVTTADRLLDLHDLQLDFLQKRRDLLNRHIEVTLDEHLQKDLDRTEAAFTRKQEALLELEINMHELISAVRGYLLKHDDFLKARVLDSESDFRFWLRRFNALPMSPEEHRWIIQIRHAFETTERYSQNIMELEDEKVVLRRTFEKRIASLNRLLDEKIEQMNIAMIEQDEANFKKIDLYISVGIITVTLLVLLVGLYLSKQFLKQISQLVGATKKYASGALGYRLPLNFDEEINLLAGSFNDMAAELMKSREEMERLHSELQQHAITDHLTQIYNREYLDDFIAQELEQSRRYQRPFSVVMVDIDHFKKINDTYGHQVGDAVLIEMTELMRQSIRRNDVLGRWGGEEFLIVSPETSLEHAREMAEKLREAIEAHDFETVGGKTASFGVSSYRDGDTETTLIERADSALYKAKSQGRNRVVWH